MPDHSPSPAQPPAPTPPSRRRRDQAFIQDVDRLFGTSHPNVVRAVDDFLNRSPGDLDYHGLRMIAAAAPHFDDQNHVAYMIDQFRVTGMNLAIESIDLDETTEMFATVVPHFRAETGRRLVLELVSSAALTVIENSPPDRVQSRARAIIEERLRRQLRRGATETSAALASPFITDEIVVDSLDHVRERIQRLGGTGSTSRQQNLDFEEKTAMSTLLGRLMRPPSSTTLSDDQLSRVWRLASQLIDDGYSGRRILESALTTPRLVELEGESMVRVVGRYESYDVDDQLGRLLASPGLSEDLARELVVNGIHHSPVDDDRWAVLRVSHYRSSDTLLPKLSSVEVDGLLAGLPTSSLNRHCIQHIEDLEALSTIARHASDLNSEQLIGLLRNEQLTTDHAEIVLEAIDAIDWTSPRPFIPGQVAAMLHCKAMNDEQLARFLRAMTPPGEGANVQAMLEIAGCHPASGDAVYREIEHRTSSFEAWSRSRFAVHLATTTPSPRMQSLLADRAAADWDDRLACSLISNGTLRNDTSERLRDSFPDIEFVPSRLFPPDSLSRQDALFPTDDREPYDPIRVFEIVESGESSPAARSAIVDSVLQGARPRPGDLLRRLLDAGLLSEEQAAQAMRHPDMHMSLACATHPRMRHHHRGIQPPDIGRLAATADAINHGNGKLPADSRLNSWKQLPDRRDAALPRTILHDTIDRQSIGDLQLELPRTEGDVTRLSEQMRNCLDGYRPRIADGSHLLAFTRDHTDTYAVVWRVVESPPDAEDTSNVSAPRGHGSASRLGRVTLIEVNSNFNQRAVPPEFRTGLEAMTQQINKGSLQPVEPTSELDAQRPDAGQSASDEEPRRVRRPPPRRRSAIPDLRLHVTDQSHQRPNSLDTDGAPSILARSDVSDTSDAHDDLAGAHRDGFAHDDAASGSPPNDGHGHLLH